MCFQFLSSGIFLSLRDPTGEAAPPLHVPWLRGDGIREQLLRISPVHLASYFLEHRMEVKELSFLNPKANKKDLFFILGHGDDA